MASSSPVTQQSDSQLLSYRICPISRGAAAAAVLTRQLAFTVRGVPLSPLPADAFVVIFLPGGGMGRDTTGFDSLQDQQRWLEEQRICLITVDRAGYGASRWSDYRAYESRMHTDADDLHALVGFLRLSRCHFVGHSGGCPGLMAYAANPAYARSIIRMALVCSGTPLCGADSPPERTLKRKVQKFLMVRPWSREWIILPTMRSLAKSWILHPDEFLKFSEREMSAPKDREWWRQRTEVKRSTFLRIVSSAMQHLDTDVEIRPSTSTSLRSAQAVQSSIVSNTVDILLSDLVESVHPFPDLSTIHSPVDVWYGDQDEVAPHGPWLAEHIRNSRAMLCEGHGHQLAFSLFPSILSRLVEPAQPAAVTSSTHQQSVSPI
jgi:pimeloyl-ACP methyl ester carboxylesterase